MLASVLEGKPGVGDEVLHGGRNEHLARFCQGRHAGTDVDGYPSDAVLGELNLTRVAAGPNLEPKVANTLTDRLGAPHRTSGPIEWAAGIE